MKIFGIDPGVSGAICVLKEGKILEVYEMPTMIDGKKNKKQINGAEVANVIRRQLDLKKDIVIVLEHVNAMPGQGVTSMFNFGQSFGVIKGISAALNVPLYLVRPTKWKKHFDLLKTNKDASRTKAIQIYPMISDKISKKKDSNKADAILIARYFFDSQNSEKTTKS